MKIQEVCSQCHVTKKAIYYYEKQQLLHVYKNQNGYREFNDEDIQRLKEIMMYRSWSISIADIRYLLDLDIDKKKEYLQQIYKQRQKELSYQQESLKQLHCFIESDDMEDSFSLDDIYQIMSDNIPQPFFDMFYEHFLPYLHIHIRTQKQQNAYDCMIDFWDHFHIKIPFSYRLLMLMSRMNRKQLKQVWYDVNVYKNQLLDSEDAYESIKQMVIKNYELQQKWWYRILSYPNRQMKIRLRDSGYYDILIPAMCELSDEYDQYYHRLMELNQRVCQELHLYYDSKFRLIKK